jgi:hypothetical protein
MSRPCDRSPRRQRLVRRLVQCRERIVLEALVQVDAGAPLDDTLEAFCCLQPADYAAAAVAALPLNKLALLNGGAR